MYNLLCQIEIPPELGVPPDGNGTAGYQAGLDRVVQLVTPSGGSLGMGNFTTST
jgi:hypothetical protein